MPGFDEATPARDGTGAPYRIEQRVVPVASLRPHPKNTYSADADRIRDLADNIAAVGLIELPFVRELGDGTLQILSGHRRARALRALAVRDSSFAEVRVRCAVGMSDADALFVLHSANIFRPIGASERIEQAERLKSEIAELRPSHPEWKGERTNEIIAQMLGVSRSTFDRRLYIAEHLIAPLHERYESGLLSIVVAKDLARQDERRQKRFLAYIERKRPATKGDHTACYERFNVEPSKLVKKVSDDITRLRSDIFTIHDIHGADGVAVDVGQLVSARDMLDALIAELGS